MSGQPLEQAMMTISYHFESPTQTMLTTARVSVADSAKAAVALREEMEERRWQLEWERRNIED